MPLIPHYNDPRAVYDPKTNAIVSLVGGIGAMFQSSLSPLLAVLAIVSGLIGMYFSVRTKRWGWFVGNLFGFLFGVIYLINYANGTFDQ